MTPVKTVYLVDDDAAVRHALTTFLSGAGYRVEEFASAERFLEAAASVADGVLVLDQRMTGMTGLELQQVLAGRDFDLPVIFITGHGSVAISVMAMKAGAMDFLEKPFSNETLLSRIREAFCRLNSQQAERGRKSAAMQRYRKLTPREQEILVYIVQGTSNRDLAKLLQISNRTIEVHRSRIMNKMQAENLPALVRMAAYCDIEPPD